MQGVKSESPAYKASVRPTEPSLWPLLFVLEMALATTSSLRERFSEYPSKDEENLPALPIFRLFVLNYCIIKSGCQTIKKEMSSTVM